MSLAVERALASMTARQILARRRAVALVLFGLLPVALAALLRARASGTAEAALASVVELNTNLIIPVILPIVALVIGTGVFGAEIDDGTAMYVLAKPVARWRIVLTRVLVAAVATALLTAPAAFLVAPAFGADAAPAGLGFAAAVAAGALLYSALFVALSLVTRRALVAGIAYVVLWEGTIASRAAGTRYLSIRQFVLSFAERMAELPEAAFNAPLTLRGALVMSVLTVVGATLYAIRRLRRFEVGEAA
jgi:ABC-2 type transport system permease protein